MKKILLMTTALVALSVSGNAYADVTINSDTVLEDHYNDNVIISGGNVTAKDSSTVSLNYPDGKNLTVNGGTLSLNDSTIKTFGGNTEISGDAVINLNNDSDISTNKLTVSGGTVNLNKGELRGNNRSQAVYDDSILSDEVIHMTNQFIFIIYQDRVLCSDHNKRNIIINLLHDAENDFSCDLLSVSTSIEDFIQQVKSIDSISITATNDLFINDFLNPTWGEDIDEKERPEATIVKMDFKRALKDGYLRGIYKKLKQPSYIKKFTIKGESNDGFSPCN